MHALAIILVLLSIVVLCGSFWIVLDFIKTTVFEQWIDPWYARKHGITVKELHRLRDEAMNSDWRF